MSAAYGAGGGRIGPAVAERLGVPFLDRAIPVAVAERLEVPVDAAAAHDEQVSVSWVERLISGFLGGDVGVPVPLPAEAGPVTPDDFRRATEEVLLRQAATGEGVILGRAAVIVLRDDPRTFRVRLDGPPDRRTRLAARLQGIDEESAAETMRRLDQAHAAYVRHFYGARLDDPGLYHLILDSTVIAIEACVELIALAAASLSDA
jgi:Cytidylate kinase-like family